VPLKAMASRLPFPNDPQMRLEEEVTLLRKSSHQAGQTKPNGHSPDSTVQKVGDSTVNQNDHAPQRRRFVFTDPVAFRFVLGPKLRELLGLT
jgi:hypothetical protein